MSAASWDGRTYQPTRTPGATVFENDEQYAICSPPVSSKTLGSGSPS